MKNEETSLYNIGTFTKLKALTNLMGVMPPLDFE